MNLQHAMAMDEETRAALASGRADPGVALFIDTMLTLRGLDDAFGEAAVGAMLEGERPVEMARDALAKAFAAIEAPGPEKRRTPSKAKAPKTWPELITLPARLQAVVREAEAGKGWEYAGPGIRSLQLKLGGAVQTQLMRISPGARTPVHTHFGREASLCLIGGFSDANGAYGPGDVSLTDPSITHQPVGDDDGVCFVLALTDAGLKFTGLFGVLQKIFG